MDFIPTDDITAEEMLKKIHDILNESGQGTYILDDVAYLLWASQYSEGGLHPLKDLYTRKKMFGRIEKFVKKFEKPQEALRRFYASLKAKRTIILKKKNPSTKDLQFLNEWDWNDSSFGYMTLKESRECNSFVDEARRNLNLTKKDADGGL